MKMISTFTMLPTKVMLSMPNLYMYLDPYYHRRRQFNCIYFASKLLTTEFLHEFWLYCGEQEDEFSSFSACIERVLKHCRTRMPLVYVSDVVEKSVEVIATEKLAKDLESSSPFAIMDQAICWANWQKLYLYICRFLTWVVSGMDYTWLFIIRKIVI
ncbi:unnamed protein product [Lactuca virosa]|uniref:Uncharacterized protein n=1 Tax=Lactuca virosa TaxID=75947 RepID=A0AAU9N5V5_9ASTR|nr:unnamed protein product [Lactuca virosa]